MRRLITVTLACVLSLGVLSTVYYTAFAAPVVCSGTVTASIVDVYGGAPCPSILGRVVVITRKPALKNEYSAVAIDPGNGPAIRLVIRDPESYPVACEFKPGSRWDVISQTKCGITLLQR